VATPIHSPILAEFAPGRKRPREALSLPRRQARENAATVARGGALMAAN